MSIDVPISEPGAVAYSRRTRRVPNPLTAAVLILFALFFVVPSLWLILAATKTEDQLARSDPLSFGSLHALAANWSALMSFQDHAVLIWLGNSALYSFVALLITLAVSVPAGYALAMMRFPGRHALLTLTLVVMLMPNATLVLPIFLETNAVHLIGSMWSIVLPFSFYPFGVYLTYIYFSTSLPPELLAAARIDGAGELGVFTRVALPLAKPVVALVGFFSFVGNWTNFFLPYVMLPEDHQFPIQVGLSMLLLDVPSFNPAVGNGLRVERPVLALATLLAISPVLLVFLFSQRYLVAGMTAGAVKD
jgi:multiple sugar transport system permease protein